MHNSGHHGFRPRLQRRDRDGLTPSSLLPPLACGYLNPFVIKELLLPKPYRQSLHQPAILEGRMTQHAPPINPGDA